MKQFPILFAALMSLALVSCDKSDYADKDITSQFDPEFASELQKLGYIDDASHITMADVADITELDISRDSYNRGSLTSLKGIEFFSALNKLDCMFNQLTSVDISRNSALEEFNCSYNRLTLLDVRKNTALETLYCIYNQLTSLDVSMNTALEVLNCSYNQLTLLDVSNNTALEYLICSDNKLTSLNVSKNMPLCWLYCGRNQLVSLDVSKNRALYDLSCSSNQLTSLDVSNHPALGSLFCSGNPGNGSIFPVTAWFDDNSIPSGFSTGSWEYDGNTITITYQKK